MKNPEASSSRPTASAIAGKTRSELGKAIRSVPGRKIGVTRRKGGADTTDLEIAIAELVPAKARFNAASTAAGFVLPGAGVPSAAGQGGRGRTAVHAESLVKSELR